MGPAASATRAVVATPMPTDAVTPARSAARRVAGTASLG